MIEDGGGDRDLAEEYHDKSLQKFSKQGRCRSLGHHTLPDMKQPGIILSYIQIVRDARVLGQILGHFRQF